MQRSSLSIMTDCVSPHEFIDFTEAGKQVKYSFIDYNTVRRHSSIMYLWWFSDPGFRAWYQKFSENMEERKRSKRKNGKSNWGWSKLNLKGRKSIPVFGGSRSAQEMEKTVIYINPGYVSQRRSSCACIYKNNGKEQIFHGLKCALELNTKFNNVRNIRMVRKSSISGYCQPANRCPIQPETSPRAFAGGVD